MSKYNDAQGVAGLLSRFDFNIINEGPGDFSTKHRKYTCEFRSPASSPSPPRTSPTLMSTASRLRRMCSPRWRATRSRSMAYS